jgi:hypothetical protein
MDSDDFKCFSYCGRMPLENGSYSECGACDRGWKRDENSTCVKCTDSLELQEILFLSFNYIIPLLLHLFLIDHAATKPPKK